MACVRKAYGLSHSMAQKLVSAKFLIIIQASQSLSDTAHSVGLLWTSDRSVAATSTWQQTKRMPSAGFERAIPANERTQSHTLDWAATESESVKNTQKLNARRCRL
jgi:hypothetical protein